MIFDYFSRGGVQVSLGPEDVDIRPDYEAQLSVQNHNTVHQNSKLYKIKESKITQKKILLANSPLEFQHFHSRPIIRLEIRLTCFTRFFSHRMSFIGT